VFTASANSLPELVTAVAAVRAGAVGLAVGDAIGGNSFEVLFLAAADLAYRFESALVLALYAVSVPVAFA
jgi:cation:H+ antiporter